MKTQQQFTIFMRKLLVLCIFAMPVRAISATLYVATNGSNTVPYDTWGKAATSIQVAIDAANPGDIIMIGSSNTGHGTGTYTENVKITKSLTIKSESGYEYTTVLAADANDHVFEVQVSNVTIGGEGCGFSVYGATEIEKAGIFLGDGTSDCTIQSNHCGIDGDHNNSIGIRLEASNNNKIINDTCNSNSLSGIFLLGSSNYNILTGNTAYGNTSQGIYLEESNSNLLSHNTCGLNKTSDEGIYLYSSNNNVLADNNCNSNNWDGIDLSSSNNNIITGNHCNSNSWDGISLYSSNYNIFTDNYCNSNTKQGIYMYNSNNNTVYLNNLSDNPSENAYVESSSGNTWNSPTPIYYDYTSGSFHKNTLGNYYGDYTGSDADGDGIGNTAYSRNGITDNYPLMATSDHYSLEAWWLNSDSKMYKDDRSKAPGSVVINAGNSKIWIASEVATKNISYSGDDKWTGQIVFNTTPASGDNFTVEIGSSTNGSNFTSAGLQATIAGDGSKTIFTFETNAKAFNLSSGNYLALKLTNNSGTNYDIQTGGAWSYCSSAKFVNEASKITDEVKNNQFSLYQNQPNPFVTTTMIRYELPERSNVVLKVYDVFGRQVTTLFEGEQNDGKYEVEFNGTNLPCGIYFYQLQAGNFRTVRKLLLLK